MPALLPAAGTLSTIGTVLSVVSTAASLFGTIGQGNAQRAALDSQAAQLTQQAGQVRASAQRDAENKRRAGAFAESRGQAVLAASGANPDSPTAIKDITDIEGQSEYGALTAMFNGEERARGLEYEASSDRLRGQDAHRAGVIGGFSNAAASLGRTFMTPTTGSAGNTLLSRYSDGDANFNPNNDEYGPYPILPWQV